MTRMTWLGVAALGALVLSGCGTVEAQSAGVSHRSTPNSSAPVPATTVSAPKTHTPPDTATVTLGHLSMAVPKSWTITKPSVPVPGAQEVEASGGNGDSMTVERMTPTTGNADILLPQVPRPQNLIKNPWNRSPYFSESEVVISGQLQATWTDLTATGSEYMVNLQMEGSESALAKELLQSIEAPHPVTTTQDVQRIQAMATSSTSTSPLPLVQATVHRDRWLLVGGEAAMAQQSWYLFHSSDSGNQWSLVNDTDFENSSPAFLDSVGSPSMLFWNASHGLIVQPGYASSELLVYRTANAGKTWSLTRVKYSSALAVYNAPKIVRSASGTLTITAELSSKQRVTFTSHNGGVTWAPPTH